MLKNILATVFSLVLIHSSLIAQDHRNCGAMEALERLQAEDPGLAERMQDIERHTEDFIAQGGNAERVVYTIPVVFHVVWNTTAENISDAQVLSQLDVLNEDFRRLNADWTGTPSVFQSSVADSEINFCLAQRDPSGNPTTGIVRVQTTRTSFSTNDYVKYTSQGGSNAWPAGSYLNIWICDLGSGLLGYAQFPGGPAATDGVVCDYLYFGRYGSAQAPFNLGRTATHEVGHWLNLRHIWGDSNCGNDQVSDTPTQQTSNYGCPSFPHVTCSNGPNGDMFMNYMDYTDDACMFMFTTGQKNRMQAVLGSGGSRASLASSQGCVPPSGGGSCGTPSGLASSNVTSSSATVSWSAVSGATSYNLQYKLSSSSTWTTVSTSSTSYGLTGLAASSTYNYQVQAVCSGGSSAYSTAANFTTQSSGGGGGCSDTWETNNNKNTAKTIPVNTEITALIGSTTDNDWYKFTNTSSQRNVKIEMYNLPFDYDVRLYRGNTQVGISQNGGTASELIIYNNTQSATTYYVRAYGYNGAYSTTQCYNLKASISGSSWRTDGSDIEEELELTPVDADEMVFLMYPNPTSAEEVNLELMSNHEGPVTVTVMDLSGKVVSRVNEKVYTGAPVTLDVSHLSTGMFLVRMDNGAQTATQKLIIQR